MKYTLYTKSKKDTINIDAIKTDTTNNKIEEKENHMANGSLMSNKGTLEIKQELNITH